MGRPLLASKQGGVSYSIHPLELCQIPAWVAILPDGASRTDMLLAYSHSFFSNLLNRINLFWG